MGLCFGRGEALHLSLVLIKVQYPVTLFVLNHVL